MATTSRSADLTSGPMLQKIILFSVPLAASSILQLLFNAADVVVVGRFAGSTALAAVGSNGALINLLVNLFVGLSLGANVVKKQEVKRPLPPKSPNIGRRAQPAIEKCCPYCYNKAVHP